MTQATTTDARAVVTDHLTKLVHRMRDAQQQHGQNPTSRNAKANAQKHGEAFFAVYMLALDLFTPQEVSAIVAAADAERN